MENSESDLGALWAHAEKVMPDGWRLDALKCASTGLELHQRSDDWTAVGLGPDGREATASGSTPAVAIDALAAAIGE